MPDLHQTYLMVTDVTASLDFYSTVLSLSVTEQSETKVAFETGGCELVLEEDFDRETLAAFGLTPPGSDRGNGAIIVFEVEDVAAVADQATEYGAPVLTGPREVEWGRELCLIEDPDGYVLEVSQPV